MTLKAPNPNVTGRETALYIAWDASETPLYLGITRNLRRRWNEHRKNKPWWPNVTHIDYRWFDSLWQAELAEQLLISQDCPLHNRNMPPWRGSMPSYAETAWRSAFEAKLRNVFTALDHGLDLEAVADFFELHPRYLVRLGRQRHLSWAEGYAGPYDDLPAAA